MLCRFAREASCRNIGDKSRVSSLSNCMVEITEFAVHFTKVYTKLKMTYFLLYFAHIYGHALISFVRAGQYVEKGQLIGRVGNTGVSTGPHLHFEIKRNNVALDPTTLINKRFLFY